MASTPEDTRSPLGPDLTDTAFQLEGSLLAKRGRMSAMSLLPERAMLPTMDNSVLQATLANQSFRHVRAPFLAREARVYGPTGCRSARQRDSPQPDPR